MIITDIIKIDKKKSKIISDEGVLFALYASEIRRLSIKIDNELSQKEYNNIIEEILFPRAKERALHLIESSEKTEYQISTKLRDGYYPEDVIERIMAFLKNYGFVDDTRYCNLYLNTYLSTKSIKVIKLDLLKKGIKQNIIEEALNEREDMDETPQIIKLLMKKKYIDVKDDYKQKNRIIAFLLRRGYGYEEISNSIKKLLEDES